MPVHRATFEEKVLPVCLDWLYPMFLLWRKILQLERTGGHPILSYVFGYDPWHSEYDLLKSSGPRSNCRRWLDVGGLLGSTVIVLHITPGPFEDRLSKGNVQDNSVAELEKTSLIMDLMGLDCSYQAKINIHIGAVYGTKKKRLKWLLRALRNYL